MTSLSVSQIFVYLSNRFDLNSCEAEIRVSGGIAPQFTVDAVELVIERHQFRISVSARATDMTLSAADNVPVCNAPD